MSDYVPLTRQQWIALAQQLLQSRFPGAGAFYDRSVLGAFANAKGAMAYAQSKNINWAARQATPNTADATGVQNWAGSYGMNYLPAGYAQGAVTVTGNPDAVIDTTAVFQSDAGLQYQVTGDVTLEDTTASVNVICLTAGVAGNLDAGAPLQLVSPPAGIQAAAVVGTDGLAGGEPAETVTQLQTRLLARIQQPPAGGNAADYQAWVYEAFTDTQNVWVNNDIANANVTVLFTVAQSAGGPIPSPEIVALVNAYIQARLPLGVSCVVASPVPVAQNFTIGLTPDTTDNRANVTSALQALIDTSASPGGTLLITAIYTAIGTAGGITDYTLNLTTNQVYAAGTIAVMGVITWT
jgi:uncharacterized phage protein gp47/JayE